MNRISRNLLRTAAALAVASALTTAVQADTVAGTIRSDCWHYYFNATPGSRTTASLFLANDPMFPQFNFRDGVAVVLWDLVLPAPMVGQPITVTSATITYYDAMNANWPVSAVNSFGENAQIELFAAGYGPRYTESTWTGSWTPFFVPPGNDFQGGWTTTGSDGLHQDRDPFPRDLVTDLHVEDNVTTHTPWAVGDFTGYTPGLMTDAFPITFMLDVMDSTIQAELQADLNDGISGWVVSSTYDQVVMGTPESTPRMIMSEGVGNATFGTSQAAPTLTIEVELASRVDGWQMYDF